MPLTDAAPDAELARLLDALAEAAMSDMHGPVELKHIAAIRAAIFAYLARTYVRREQADEDERNAEREQP